MEAQAARETLAGHNGHCKDFRKADGTGNRGNPFTWLSEDNSPEACKELARELAEVKKRGGQVTFEAWELVDEDWQLTLDGSVRVLYVEVCGQGAEVRTLLQWATGGRPTRSMARTMGDEAIE